MTSAAHVTMTVHPVFLLLLLLPCLLVLPCSCGHVSGSIRIVKNQTVNSSDDCDATKLCGPEENCTHTLLNRDQTRCYVLSCSERSNSSCEEATRVEELLQEQESASEDHTHTTLLQSSSGNHSLLNGTSSSPDANVSSTTSTLHPTPTSTSSTLHPTPTRTSSTLHPTPTSTSSTLHPTPTRTSSTLHPTPTSTSSTLHPTPTISTSQMSSTTAAEAKPAPSPSPHATTPSSTTAKASTRPSEVSTTQTKSAPTTLDHSRSDTAVAGDPLTSHLLNTSSLLAVLLFGLLFLVVTLALFLKQAYESFKRKDYTQVDYLINGMYSDSGV